MENKNDIRIAGAKKIEEWEALSKKLDQSSIDSWKDAFNFFEERIRTRYLKPIRTIQYSACELGEGFAMVSLQCALIETIESFINGWIYDKDRKPNYFRRTTDKQEHSEPDVNGTFIFENFFKKREPFKDLKIEGKDFFKYVRCGLLHETQTKKGWLIRAEHTSLFYEEEGSQKILYRNNFQDALEKVIEDYKQAIVNGTNLGDTGADDLRLNFKAKFDHICEISKTQK